ncbi:hypothetical protein CO2235_U1010059 [Cupriavidus oxalaticus]|uniref:Uncharacterized protein n=1 Tax=Cupriavidus oxalaticus TaxID=96344 RepID=A0A375FI61_9BURK|nr:hypothetical protein CO2235_U1010059 [Cupriavidus oxalaticus]
MRYNKRLKYHIPLCDNKFREFNGLGKSVVRGKVVSESTALERDEPRALGWSMAHWKFRYACSPAAAAVSSLCSSFSPVCSA